MKRFTALLLSVLLVLYLTGCGSSGGITIVSKKDRDDADTSEASEDNDEKGSGLTVVVDKGDDSSDGKKEENRKDEASGKYGTDDGKESPSAAPTVNSPAQISVSSEYNNFTDYDSSTYMTFAHMQECHLTVNSDNFDCGKLQRSLDTLYDEKSASIRSEYEYMCEESRSMYEEDPSWFEYGQYSEYSDSATVVRSDTNVLSFWILCSGYYIGAAHGWANYGGYSYNSSTGERIYISDAVTDVEMFAAIVREKLFALYPDLDPDWAGDYLDGVEKGDYDWNFTLGHFGLTVVFNPYEVDCYAAGTHYVDILYSEYPDLFPDYIKSVPDEYVHSFNSWTGFTCDYNSDGIADYITVNTKYDDNTYMSTYSLSVNGEGISAPDGCYGYDVEPYYISTPWGAFVYLFTHADNDYGMLYVFNVSQLSYVGSMHAYVDSRYTSNGDWDYTITEYYFTNPDEFTLGARVHALGTYTGTRHYYMDASGMPAPFEELYYPNKDVVLTALCDIKGSEYLTEDPITVTEGTSVTIYGTDCSSYILLRLPDNSIIKLDYNTEEYPRYINGMDEMDVFDGIYYAG